MPSSTESSMGTVIVRVITHPEVIPIGANFDSFFLSNITTKKYFSHYTFSWLPFFS